MNIRKNKNRIFWIVNTTAWLTICLFVMLVFYTKQIGEYRTTVAIGITYLTGFVITVGMRYFYRIIRRKNFSIITITIIIVLTSFIMAQIWFFTDYYISMLFVNPTPLSQRSLLGFLSETVISRPNQLMVWSGLYFLFNFWLDWLQQKELAEESILLAHKAQLLMLRYQLNPHFLFNALNTVRALIEEDKEKAKLVITELSEFLRYSLISDSNTSVPFEKELEAIKSYFAIQKIRYEEKLNINFNIQSGAEKFNILSFLVYPLIENAVKYGMQTSKMPLQIDIEAITKEDALIIKVTNTGEWIEKETNTAKGTQKGLDNIRERLKNAYPGKHIFEIKQNNDKVIITIIIYGSGNAKNNTAK